MIPEGNELPVKLPERRSVIQRMVDIRGKNQGERKKNTRKKKEKIKSNLGFTSPSSV